MFLKKEKYTISPGILNILYLPVLILITIFIFIPFLNGIKISFTNWDGFSQSYSWVGLENFRRFFSDPSILIVLKNTFIYGMGSTFFQTVIGLGLALILDKKFRGNGVARAIVYLPVIIAQFIMGYIWYFFFQYDGGAINDVLIALGKQPFDWLAIGSRAVWIIMGVNTFQYVGTAMVIFLAGLQSIPRDYYEVAAIDGASGFKTFKHITLPLLMPAITNSIILNIIYGLQLFASIKAMTNGGPGYASSSMSVLMYNLYFGRQDAGYSATVGIVMFVIICIISITILNKLRSKEVEI
jgi:raffinose/stachyose/melibiose transport system permease protein